ncbi:MAG TPA: LamG-like jellyroll fold domain-containing protein [Capsulimonadaceae bacterium]|jgi:hypothetical protein
MKSTPQTIGAMAALSALTLLVSAPTLTLADEGGRPSVNTAVVAVPATDKNSVLVEKYVFNAGTGDTVPNAVAGGDPVTLHATTWTTPGYKDAKAAVRLDGKTSNIPLASRKTPITPISLKFVVKPAALSGLLFGDVGGLTVQIQPTGRVLCLRHEGKWAAVESADSLTVGQWAEVEYQWDGAVERVFIDGKLSAEAPAGPGFASANRGLGCNFYGATSNYFAGDIASFELRTLKK